MPQRSRSNPGFAAYSRNFANNAIPPQAVSTKNFRYVYDEFRGPIFAQTIGGAAVVGTTGATNQFTTGSHWPYTIEQFILGAGETIIAPVLASGNGGLSVGLDLTSTEGQDLVFGAPQAGTTAGKLVFQSRVDRAFFARLKLTIADVSGVNPLYFGWKKCTAANATFATGAPDHCSIAILTAADPAVIQTSTLLNAAGGVNTDTLLTWADGETKTLAVDVDGEGYARQTLDGVNIGPGNFRFDASDYLCPYFRFLHAATTPGAITLKSFECGFKAR